MSQFLQYLLSGVTVGSIYAIVAIGFNLIYSTTGILNFAQGEFVMLGGMTAVTLSAFMPLPVALVLSVAVVVVFGALLELLFFRHLRRPTPLQMLIITVGLAIVIREVAVHVWDEQPHRLAFFSGDECSSVAIFGAAISPQVFWVLGTLCLSVVLLHLFLHHTLTGRAMRACASNPEAAMLAGIDVRRLRTLAFMISAGLGALGGAVIAPITSAQYDQGTGLAIKGFAAAILGGFGAPAAAVPAGLLVGLAEALSVGVGLPAAYKDAAAFALLVMVLILRPHGLFANRGHASLEERV
ncbi:MAG: branched-chain amino acid ABC transporter permease [Lentisphaerae bacterium]|nr:branched-chain amino acid ABC transporter permease [Lentisphaerota bacterium]